MSMLADVDPEELREASQQLDDIQKQVEQAMQDMIDEGVIAVNRSEYWIEITMNAEVLFDSGSATLYPRMVPVLTKLGKSLRDFPNNVHIEGHTDTVPISTDNYPSNWELSGSRAATVVRLLEFSGVRPNRLAAVGFGEHYPVASNSLASGRAKNRRVVAVVLADVNESTEATLQRFEKLDGTG